MSPKDKPMTDLSPDNKIINGLWISPNGKPLSNLERLCIHSFCANGHDFRLWTYGNLQGVPENTAPGKVEVRDGNEIVPEDGIFSVHGSLSTFSDYFRWELMRKHGGWWADVDVVCLQPLNIAAETFYIRWSTDSVGVTLLKFPKGHFFTTLMAEACANPNKIVPWDTRRIIRRKIKRRLMFWRDARKGQGVGRGEVGCEGAWLAMKHFDMLPGASSCLHLHMIERYDFNALFNAELSEAGILPPLLDAAYCIHFSNEMMRLRGMDKDGDYHLDSPFEILKRRYLPELQENQ